MPRIALTNGEIQRYRTLGYLALPDFLAPHELEELRSCWEDALARRGRDHLPRTNRALHADSVVSRPGFRRRLASLLKRLARPDHWRSGSKRDPGNRYWAREHCNLRLDHRGYAELIRKFGMGELVSRLTGTETVRIYSDRSATKRAADGATFWHVDGPCSSYDSRDACVLWMALSDATVENGCLRFLPGSSSLIPDGPIERMGAMDGLFREFPELAQIDPVSQPLPAGGCVVFNSWMAHAAGPNLTRTPREIVSLVFMPDGSGYNGRHHYYYGRELYDRLAPGDALDDPELFPVVFPP